MEGEEYIALIDEFMAAVKLRWPRALVQFEDFQSKYAIKLLQRSDCFCWQHYFRCSSLNTNQ